MTEFSDITALFNIIFEINIHQNHMGLLGTLRGGRDNILDMNRNITRLPLYSTCLYGLLCLVESDGNAIPWPHIHSATAHAHSLNLS